MKKRTDWYKNIKIKRDKSTSFLIKKRFQRTHASLSSSYPHDTITRLLDYCMSGFFFYYFFFWFRNQGKWPKFKIFPSGTPVRGNKNSSSWYLRRPPPHLCWRWRQQTRHARQDAILFLLLCSSDNHFKSYKHLLNTLLSLPVWGSCSKRWRTGSFMTVSDFYFYFQNFILNYVYLK